MGETEAAAREYEAASYAWREALHRLRMAKDRMREAQAAERAAIRAEKPFLSEREMHVLAKRDCGHTFASIGRELGISGGRVAEIWRAAVRKRARFPARYEAQLRA